MAEAQKPANDSVRIYEHWQAGGVAGHGWDVFFGDDMHRTFDRARLARDAATRWAKTHSVSVWITESRGMKWRLLVDPS